MIRIEDGTVVIGGRSMIVRRAGVREGPPVLLLHPLGLDRRAFAPLRHALGGALAILSSHHSGHGRRASSERFPHPKLVDVALEMIRLHNLPVHPPGTPLGRRRPPRPREPRK